MGSLNPEDELNDSGYVQEDAAVKVVPPAEKKKISAHLLDLSDDVLLYILQYCSPLDLKALGFACPRLGTLVLDRTLWQRVDARGTPTGARRMRWLLTHALSVHTTSLKLSGYAREVNRYGGGVPYCQDLVRGDGAPPRDDSKEQTGNICPGLQVTLTHSTLRRFTNLCSNLTELVLEHVIIDCHMTRISMFPQSLKVLSLLGTKCFNMEKSFLYKINDHLINLEDLDVSECLWLEPACLLPLSKLPRLTRLAMRLCAKLTEFVAYASLATRYGFKQLKFLDMRGSPVGDSEVSALGWVPLLEELYLSPASSYVPAAAPVLSDPLPWEDEEPEYYKSKYDLESWIEEENLRLNSIWRADECAVGSRVLHHDGTVINIGPDGDTARMTPGAPLNTGSEMTGNVQRRVISPNNGMKRTTNTGMDTEADRGSGESSTNKDRKGKKDLKKRKQERDSSPAKRFKDEDNFSKESCSYEKPSNEVLGDNSKESSNISNKTFLINESTSMNESTNDEPSLDGSSHEPFSSKDQKTKKVPTKRPRQHDAGESSKKAFKDLDDCKKRKELRLDSEHDDKLSSGDDGDDDDDDDSPPTKRCPINKAVSTSVEVGEGSSKNLSESEPNSQKSNTENEGSNLKETGLNSNEPNVSQGLNVNPQPNRPSTSQETRDNQPKLQCYIRFRLNRPPVVIDPCGNPPVMGEGFNNQPVMREGCGNQPVMREGCSNQPVMREGCGNQPVMREVCSNQPVMREDCGNQPVMREGCGNQPVMREGCGNQPVMREGCGNQPAMREGCGNQPVMREGCGNQPVMRAVCSNQPVMREGCGNHPVMREGCNQPVIREGCGNRPVMRESCGNQPVMREDCGNQPAEREGCSNQPVDRESCCNQQPFIFGCSHEHPSIVFGCNNPPQFVIEGYRYRDDNHNIHNNNDAQQMDWNSRLNNNVYAHNMERQEPPSPRNYPEEYDVNANDVIQDPNYMPRHRILHVNVRRRRHALYQISLPESVHLHIQHHHAALNRMYPLPIAPRLVYTSLVTDSAIRRFGRADGENINYVQIGPMGLVPAPYDDPHARPNRSNLRVLSATGFGHITNSSLTHLATAAPHLQSIDFTGTRVTEEGVEHFRNLRPDCEVKYGSSGSSEGDGSQHSRDESSVVSAVGSHAIGHGFKPNNELELPVKENIVRKP